MARARTLREACADAESTLRQAGVESPRAQASALLCAAMGIDRAAVLARLADRLPAEAASRFDALVRRRAAREPLQYLLGRAPFLEFEVRVGPGVFIPRPETEQLVQAALASWEPTRTLAIDLCTGSGAIAIALARARLGARVLAIDLSATALASARRSATDLRVAARIDFLHADLLSPLRAAGAWRERLGALVCNPPYVPPQDITQPEVRDWEPALALHAGADGLDLYRRVIPQAAALLLPGRPLLLELGYGQAAAVATLLATDGRWDAPRIEADFQGIPRVLTVLRAAGAGGMGSASSARAILPS